jgi:hypothetical protein
MFERIHRDPLSRPGTPSALIDSAVALVLVSERDDFMDSRIERSV